MSHWQSVSASAGFKDSYSDFVLQPTYFVFSFSIAPYDGLEVCFTYITLNNRLCTLVLFNVI